MSVTNPTVTTLKNGHYQPAVDMKDYLLSITNNGRHTIIYTLKIAHEYESVLALVSLVGSSPAVGWLCTAKLMADKSLTDQDLFNEDLILFSVPDKLKLDRLWLRLLLPPLRLLCEERKSPGPPLGEVLTSVSCGACSLSSLKSTA